jgi:hypothetical protein
MPASIQIGVSVQLVCVPADRAEALLQPLSNRLSAESLPHPAAPPGRLMPFRAG